MGCWRAATSSSISIPDWSYTDARSCVPANCPSGIPICFWGGLCWPTHRPPCFTLCTGRSLEPAGWGLPVTDQILLERCAAHLAAGAGRLWVAAFLELWVAGCPVDWPASGRERLCRRAGRPHQPAQRHRLAAWALWVLAWQSSPARPPGLASSGVVCAAACQRPVRSGGGADGAGGRTQTLFVTSAWPSGCSGRGSCRAAEKTPLLD
jgi:hypothetical protein